MDYASCAPIYWIRRGVYTFLRFMQGVDYVRHARSPTAPGNYVIQERVSSALLEKSDQRVWPPERGVTAQEASKTGRSSMDV